MPRGRSACHGCLYASRSRWTLQRRTVRAGRALGVVRASYSAVCRPRSSAPGSETAYPRPRLFRPRWKRFLSAPRSLRAGVGTGRSPSEPYAHRRTSARTSRCQTRLAVTNAAIAEMSNTGGRVPERTSGVSHMHSSASVHPTRSNFLSVGFTMWLRSVGVGLSLRRPCRRRDRGGRAGSCVTLRPAAASRNVARQFAARALNARPGLGHPPGGFWIDRPLRWWLR